MAHGTGKRLLSMTAIGALSAGILAACGTDDENGATADEGISEADSVVVYSGRSEDLVGPIIDQIEESAGVSIDVRYGDTPELAAQIAEEGDATPADVFFSQDAGALGALDDAGALAELPSEVVDLVADGYHAEDNSWVATSLRSRALFYDTSELEEDEVPGTIDELLEPEWQGRVAYAPGNAGFQAFVTALRVDRGDEAAEQWLTDFLATEPVEYENNRAMLEAVDAGEIDLGLSNHYYWYNHVKEVGEDAVNAGIAYLEPGDPGALVNVAGVGVLASSDVTDEAFRVVEALLSPESQQYFLDETSEYPVIDGIDTEGTDLPPLESLAGPDIDLSDLESLDETQSMLQRVGMI